VKLAPITEDELAAFMLAVEQQYAAQKSSMGGVSDVEARAQAERETAILFPKGRPQPGHAIFTMVRDDGVRLGRVWLAPHRVEPGLAFVYDIQIEPEHRGNGYGRALMELAQDWARSSGYTSISLHVFGGNEPAISLYKSLGYEVTDLSMRRTL
jgi:ribosomal protein S18 acetylase RimI-like enzyme